MTLFCQPTHIQTSISNHAHTNSNSYADHLLHKTLPSLTYTISHIHTPSIAHTGQLIYTPHVTPFPTHPISHTYSSSYTQTISQYTPISHTQTSLPFSHTQHTHRPFDTQTSISHTHHATQTHVDTYLFFSLKET